MRAIWIIKTGGPDVLQVRETPDPDPHIGIGYRLAKDSVVTLSMDVFNVFNFQAPTGIDNRYTNHLKPMESSAISRPPAGGEPGTRVPGRAVYLICLDEGAGRTPAARTSVKGGCACQTSMITST